MGAEPTAGRGYDYGHYSWSQTLPEVSKRSRPLLRSGHQSFVDLCAGVLAFCLLTYAVYLRPDQADGSCSWFVWAHTGIDGQELHGLHNVNVSVPVPPGIRAKMMDVVISKTKLKVGVKGQPPIIEVGTAARAVELLLAVREALMLSPNSTFLPEAFGRSSTSTSLG
eukprot:1158220-Pelagomonas_calceolata.AAC.2